MKKKYEKTETKSIKNLFQWNGMRMWSEEKKQAQDRRSIANDDAT